MLVQIRACLGHCQVDEIAEGRVLFMVFQVIMEYLTGSLVVHGLV